MTFDEIMAQFSTATNAANAANKERFDASLDLLTNSQLASSDAYKQAYDLLGNLGSTSRIKISDAATKAEGSATQNATSGGLYNTTMLDSMLRDVAAGKQSSLTDLEAAIAAQKAELLTQGASANTQAAASISDLYKSAYDNAPDAAIWANLATQASATPTGRVTNSSSRGLSDVTDTMSNTTPSGGVTTPSSSVMVTGTPTGSTWGSSPTPVADTSPATPVNWDTALTQEDTGDDTTDTSGMSFDDWAATTSGDTGATGQMADDMLGQLGLGDMSASDLLGVETPTETPAVEQPLNDATHYNGQLMKPGQMYWDETSHTWQARGRKKK